MKLLSSNLVYLTSILSDLEFHDGDSLGIKLGITRSAVWKAIKKLKNYGIEIISTKNKGYQLKEPLLLLDQAKLKEEVADSNIKIEVFEDIDSTNSYLKKNIDPLKRRICFAETQTSGRGRMGRAWHSPFGKNILMSYAYPFKKDVSELNGLSLVVGIACLNAIKEIGIDVPIDLKWPNDGMHKGQKLMGNLVELQSESYGETIVVIGIGINVNMILDSSSITQEWTSLKKITSQYIDINQLCIALIHNLNLALEQFIKYGLREFMPKWQKLDYLYNKKITLNNGDFSGIAKGINEQGNLLLELETGELKAFSSGEASICVERQRF
jgi:BirA family biotin operon repressor/biotin-[acetyl-CoA-carboxylase] ligase